MAELRTRGVRHLLGDAPSQLRREKECVNPDRRPGRRQGQVVRGRRAEDSVRPALDLVLRARRPQFQDWLRRDDVRERIDGGKRDEGRE